MSAVDIALPRIKEEEGYRGRLYTDSEGKATIGCGFNISAGISEYAANALLVAQLQEIDHSLNAYSWYGGLDAIRQSVLLDIAFNAGTEGLLKFPHMLAALAAKDWGTAANECRVTNPGSPDATNASRESYSQELPNMVIGIIIGLILGAPIGAYAYYRWGTRLAADLAKVKSVV